MYSTVYNMYSSIDIGNLEEFIKYSRRLLKDNVKSNNVWRLRNLVILEENICL